MFTPAAARHDDLDTGHGALARITVTTTCEHATVAVRGELDLSVTTPLHERVTTELRLSPAALVLDLTDVTFCSAGALAVLLEAVTTAHARGIPSAVIATHRAILRPIELLRLGRILPIHQDRAEALEWLSLVARLRDSEPTS
ncbi:anti-anti-sigma factor [Amycolatopsis pretoriensis]|uniref:Anti-sigma factor antagonist n=1 Tax=Amycolatopsis pretoriensis TaxID=218821 RepID=A0A1H5RIQ7_9PSEU|nr:STAS domain-containing protein [Amycolatopsis pretoriensis]SEF37391.1 anti-anti-sigma factor [Amycolatopsis pretoriensis]